MGMEKAIWNYNTDSQSHNEDFWIVASGYYTSDVPLLACLLFGGADMLKSLTPPTSRCLKWNMSDQQRTWCKATCPVFPCTEGTYTIYIHLQSSKSWISKRLVFWCFWGTGLRASRSCAWRSQDVEHPFSHEETGCFPLQDWCHLMDLRGLGRNN